MLKSNSINVHSNAWQLALNIGRLSKVRTRWPYSWLLLLLLLLSLLIVDVNCGNTKLNEDIFVAVVIAILTLKNFGTSTGLEPMASALALQCPNELSYGDERNKLACSQCMGLHSSIGLKILLSKLVSNEVNQKALRRIVFRRLR